MSKPAKKPRKKPTNEYKMPEPLPPGEILTDLSKKQWRLGTSIGKGGFGEIYSAQDASKTSSKYPYVVKVEPHNNGPLFVEMHFYMNNAKQGDIEAFMDKHKLKTFGMPVYLGSGSHLNGTAKYRFIVLEKFGIDIDKLRDGKGGLPVATVFQLAWQITFVLEYIHERGYVHADIKGGNVLLGATFETKSQVYLLDFGLAAKYSKDKEFKPNPKKAHDGTLEYLSRDAHQGVPTRRGDLEVLAFNLIYWLGGSLPWDNKLDNPKLVQRLKEESLNDIPVFVKMCLKKTNDTISRYLQYVNSLKFNERPNYKKVRLLFEEEIRKNGSSVNAPLDFQGRKRNSLGDEDTETEEKKTEDVVQRRGKKEKKNEEVLTVKKESFKEGRKNGFEERVANGEFDGYNAEMIEIKKKIMNKKKENLEIEVLADAMEEILVLKEKKNKKIEKNTWEFYGYTAEMIEITMKKRQKETVGGHLRRNR